MNNKLYNIILCSIFFIFISCQNSRYEKFKTRNYELAGGGSYSRVYKNEVTGDYGELPSLPYGLFLYYDWKSELFPHSLYLPTLDFEKRKEDVDIYPLNNIIRIQIEKEYIYVNTENDTKYKIESANPWNIIQIETLPVVEDGKSYFFYNNGNCFSLMPQNILSLQDRRQNKKYHVDYSTPVINGILKIGKYDDELYFGQTLFSYFVLDLNTDKLIYFNDEDEYKEFLKTRILHSVEIIESSYCYQEEMK